MSLNFITKHLVSKIQDEVKIKEKILKHDGFLMLDEPVQDQKLINRLNRYSPYPKEELIPVSWYLLKGKTILEIYSKVKRNEFFIYKLLDGKNHKMRIKKK